MSFHIIQRSKHEEAERRYREEEARRRGKKGYEDRGRTNESENTDEQGGAAFPEYMRITMIQKIPTVLRDFRVHVAFILILIICILLLIILLLLYMKKCFEFDCNKLYCKFFKNDYYERFNYI